MLDVVCSLCGSTFAMFWAVSSAPLGPHFPVQLVLGEGAFLCPYSIWPSVLMPRRPQLSHNVSALCTFWYRLMDHEERGDLFTHYLQKLPMSNIRFSQVILAAAELCTRPLSFLPLCFDASIWDSLSLRQEKAVQTLASIDKLTIRVLQST
jgi:hypothetical protein